MSPSEASVATIETIANECIAVRLRMLNRSVTNLYNEALRPLELKVSQMNILVAVARLGVARPTEVCSRLHLSISTLSRNLDRMKSRGWVEALEEPDARTQPVRLTSRGRALLDKAAPSWQLAQAQALELIGEDGLQLLRKTTRSLNSLSQAG